MADPKDHSPRPGKGAVDGTRGQRGYTSKAAERAARRSATTGRRVGRVYHRSTSVRTATRAAESPAPRDESELVQGGFGGAKGLIWIAPDFDEPLEEFDPDS